MNIIPHSERHIAGVEPCEVVYCGLNGEGRSLYDVWCNEIGDYLATVPAFPTTNKERAKACARHGNEEAARRAALRATDDAGGAAKAPDTGEGE